MDETEGKKSSQVKVNPQGLGAVQKGAVGSLVGVWSGIPTRTMWDGLFPHQYTHKQPGLN